MPSPQKPRCDACWFSKVKTVPLSRITDGGIQDQLRLYCLREPEIQPKDPDDFCMHHPAWAEHESRNHPDLISGFYADRDD